MQNSASVHDGKQVLWFEEIRRSDVASVGGKNSSLGELISQLSSLGINVPRGFATTVAAYRNFIAANRLDTQINRLLKDVDLNDLSALARAGSEIRQLILGAQLPMDLKAQVQQHFEQLCRISGSSSSGAHEASFAVRSSATAEDLEHASFAGQQETFLNIRGIDAVLDAIKRVYSSLYTDRALSYRAHHGFKHQDVGISVGIQRMVRSDIGSSGVMFTIDTESGFNQVVFITACFGLGETIVQGAVNPDEFYVYKPALLNDRPAVLRRVMGSKAVKTIYSDSQEVGSTVLTVAVPESERMKFALSDEDALRLARYACLIEKHYGQAMDIEWAKDGQDNQLYILQARPETVESRASAQTIKRYSLKRRSKVLARGRSIGQRAATGVVRIAKSLADIKRFEPGNVLVTDMTDPDWEPVMAQAAAIVTNRGGRTCHAAIIARELGKPAVVGCGDATEQLKDGMEVTVSCCEGDDGFVYEGNLGVEVLEIDIERMPEIPVKICMNVGSPERAFEFQRLPNQGVGLARIEFIIAGMIGLHPKAALQYPQIDAELKKQIEQRCAGYENPAEFYVKKLAEGVSTICAAFWPKPVIVRLSDFKSNEYRGLLGGQAYEPEEENPMIGFRGASRYVAAEFKDCFALECRALKFVRDEMGLTNLEVMVPFVRTLKEARDVVDILGQNGLRRGENGLRLIMMCEIPSNALLAPKFLELFDGFSIGSNDMTQLTLGLDRDSALVAACFDERDPAVTEILRMAIAACKKSGKYVGICGQGPSDHPDFAGWLLDQGIDAISLNPDTVVDTWMFLANQKQ